MNVVMTYNRSFRILHQASKRMHEFDTCCKGIKSIDYYRYPGFYPVEFYATDLFVESEFTPTTRFFARNISFTRNVFVTPQVDPVYILITGIKFTPGDPV